LRDVEGQADPPLNSHAWSHFPLLAVVEI
jgi:hypothetical protein